MSIINDFKTVHYGVTMPIPRRNKRITVQLPLGHRSGAWKGGGGNGLWLSDFLTVYTCYFEILVN